jgi:hypothetical protein
VDSSSSTSGRLILAAVLAALAIALLFVTLRPRLAGPEPTPTPAALGTAPPLESRAPTPSAPPATPAPASTATPPPEPRIEVGAASGPRTISFALRGQAPRGATEALLWYDTSAGHAIRRIPLNGAETISASVTITPTQEGLTLTEPLDGGLDYWWAVRDRQGTIVRRAASLDLPPKLAALAHTTPVTAPAQVAWVERATQHFRLRAPPDTAAARDLGRLAEVAEASYGQATHVITATGPVSISVYMVPRVFWQGGVAYGSNGPLVISYLDRNYAGVESWTYLVHEVTHALGDHMLPRGAEVGGLLGEGVAVYTTGGHYGLEPLDAWAAALAASDRYVPLCRLRYDFYNAQHEVAYAEGASFTKYLIQTYGLEAFRRMYAAQQPQRGQPGGVDAFCAADNRRGIAPTNKDAGALEQDWLAHLKTIQPTDQQRRSWDLTVRFFDTMRRYQELLDKPARDLPPPPASWDRATAAKFLNAASGRRAVVLETMLGTIEPALRRGDLAHADALLDAVDASLSASGVLSSSLARDYDSIAGLVEAQARALRRGDEAALARTLAAPSLATTLPFTTGELLRDLRYTLVQLDVRGDSADGVVQVDGASLAGRQIERALYRARFARAGSGWSLADWAPQPPEIDLPPGPGAIGGTR